MKTFALACLTALMMLFSASAFADDRDFAIVNATGYPIKFIGVNPPGDTVYNENELEKVLNDGSSINVKFSGSDKGCTWNIKVTWADDNTSSFFSGLNLCTIETVTLKYDRKSDTASYVAK